MGKTPRTFTPEFKLEAVRLAQTQGTAKTARDLGISDTVLGRWVRQVKTREAEARPAFTGRGTPALSEHEARIKQLEREVAVLRQEREILKAAAVFFAKEGR